MSSFSLTSKKPIIKQVLDIGTKKIVIIDSYIIEKLGMNKGNTFLEQQITADGNILMRVVKEDNEMRILQTNMIRNDYWAHEAQEPRATQPKTHSLS